MTKFRSTAEQKQIIKLTCGNSVVNACAGSGKTTTLALRTQHLIENGCNPKHIAIITYSKALADDIETKLSHLIDPSIAEKVTVSTIHSLALGLVTKYHRQLGFKQTPKLGKNIQQKFVKKTAKSIGLSTKELSKAFTSFDTGETNKATAGLVKKKAGLATKAYGQYLKAKKTKNIIDYNDMIKLAVQLLDESKIKLPFQHLMVDELQDIDPHQTELLKQLSPLMKSVVMVGDPLQLIYGWRQASPDYWVDINKDLQPKQYCLTESFRIPQQALFVTNRIARSIDENAPRLRSHVQGEKPVLVKLDTAER